MNIGSVNVRDDWYRRVGPKVFQIIERPELRHENMNKNRAIVHSDPAGAMLSVNRERFLFRFLMGEIPNGIGEGGNLCRCVALANDHVLADRAGCLIQVDCNDVFAFFLLQAFDNWFY